MKISDIINTKIENTQKEYIKITLIARACKTSERIIEVSLNTNIVNSANKDAKACERLYDMIVNKGYVQLPDFAVESWKKNEDLDAETIANLTAKVSQATSFLEGLKNTPDDVNIGVLRSFIDANYENITK